MSPRLSLIVAMSENGVIGRDNGLPWRISEDLKWFRECTMGKPCIMGRKTWESLPRRPLPGRTNIVITRDKAYRADCAHVVSSLEAAIEVSAREGAPEIMIIGGAEIYRSAFAKAQRIYLTRVHGRFEGGVFFPAYDPAEWVENFVAEHAASAERAIGYSWVILDRKSKERG